MKKGCETSTVTDASLQVTKRRFNPSVQSNE